MSWIGRAVTWATLGCMLACAGASTGAGRRTSHVAGRVTALSGLALPGARVLLADTSGEASRETVTDTAGLYSFKRVPPGDYRLEVSVADFETKSRKLAVGPGDARADVGLRLVMIEDDPICHLSGRVSQEGHEPIARATVTAVAVFDSDIRRSALTDRNGRFTLVLDRAAQYVILAHSPEFAVRSGDFACFGGVEATLDFLLSPASDTPGLGPDGGVVQTGSGPDDR